MTGINREKDHLSESIDETRAQVEQLKSQVKALEEKNKEQSLRIAKLSKGLVTCNM